MSPLITGLVIFIFLFVLIAFKMPIGAAMGLLAFIGLWYLISASAAFAKLAIVPFQIVTDYNLAVLPLFLLMAQVIVVTGMGSGLFNIANKWLGNLPGGVAQATIAGCAGFAAVSSSSIATAATAGMIAIPEMKRLKYDPALATGTVAAGGGIGILIPPSGVMIVYGILTETSIGKLFAAGVIPGILEALLFMTVIGMLCIWRPALGPRGGKTSLKEKIAVLGEGWDIVLLIVLVLGGIIVGWFTPTEAGAVGAFGAIVISLARRRLTWSKFREAILETLKTTGMIYGILIGAFVFNYFLAVTDIPSNVANFVSNLALPPVLIIVVIMLIYLLLGCFLDAAAMTVLTIPIFFPIVMNLGFDPVWFGILVVMAMEMAMITPPIGMNVFVIAGIAKDVPIQTIFKGIMPFLLAEVILIAILILAPNIVLFLPKLMV